MDDPWIVISRRASSRVGVRSVGVVLIGAGGSVVRLWLHGGPQVRPAATVLVVVAAAIELSLCLRGSIARGVAVAAVSALGVGLTVPIAGRAPVVIVISSVVLARLALVPAKGSDTSMAPAPLVVPVLVLTQVVWVRTGSLRWCGALLVMAVVTLVASTLAPRRLRSAERALARGSRALGEVVAVVGMAVVIFPLLYLPGLIMGRVPHSRSWTTASCNPIADASLPFISPPARVRRRRHLTAGAVIVVAASAIGLLNWSESARTLTGVDPQAPGSHPSASPAKVSRVQAPRHQDDGNQLDMLDDVPYSDRAGLRGRPWADRLQADTRRLRLSPRPDVGYVTADAATDLVNVRGGMRRTISSPCAGCPTRTLWLAGGSVAFGIGQRDVGTIASDLVRLAARRGIDLRVRNLGTVGWTIHQEVTDVIARLDRGEPAPDGVVFVDGFNDAMAAAIQVFGGRPDGGPLLLDPEAGLDLVKSGAADDPDLVARAAARAATSYRSEQERVRVVLDPYGVRSWFFFQPDAFASARQLEAVRSTYRRSPKVLEGPGLPMVLDATTADLAGAIIDLRSAYDTEAPVFIDVVHTGERGAQLVADRIDAAIGAWLTDR